MKNPSVFDKALTFLSPYLRLYKGIASSLSKYWAIYGGLRDLLISPYLHFSFLISVVTYRSWKGAEECWYNVIITVIPGLLGFTFAGFAILLTFGGDIRRVLCGADPEGKPSPFLVEVSAIVHFLVIQCLALMYALILKPFDVTSGVLLMIGVILLYYSISLALAAVLAMFRIATYVDKIPPDTSGG